MPKNGFKSVTLHNEFVDRMNSFISHNKGKSIPSYINSPATLVEYYFQKQENEKKALAKIANKINKVPASFMSYS